MPSRDRQQFVLPLKKTIPFLTRFTPEAAPERSFQWLEYTRSAFAKAIQIGQLTGLREKIEVLSDRSIAELPG